MLNAPLSHEAATELLQQAFHRGITFFDTANVYGNGESEIMIGKALKKLPRELVQVGTKFGLIIASLANPRVNGSPEHVRECIEASLKRLDVDYVDLYFQHRVDTSVPIEETIRIIELLDMTYFLAQSFIS